MTHAIDIAALTVIATDENGERHDLNAGGAPCADIADLRDFVIQLHGERAFDVDTMNDLLNELGGGRLVRV